ncbi:MAG: Sporulation related domain [Acidobacteria bacterium]|nr:Sporulation related domain [Acidobacteriota bacterium]
MDPRGAEAGTELVLDNRKLILSFLLLIVVCGAFFIIGFMEGKRQAIRTQAAKLGPAAADGAGQAAGGTGSAPREETAGQDRSVREQLDWYRSVQGNDAGPGKTADSARIPNPPAGASPKKPVADPESKADASAAAAPPAAVLPKTGVTYSVQVGAFRQRSEADVTLGLLKTKGFDGVIEPSPAPDDLHLVKVGRFKTRAEAVALELRLKKAGFSCFIKTN